MAFGGYPNCLKNGEGGADAAVKQLSTTGRLVEEGADSGSHVNFKLYSLLYFISRMSPSWLSQVIGLLY